MAFAKRTLFVQPDTNLFYASREAQQVINILHANILNGEVNIEDLIQSVREFQPELIIISSHGTENGILLSDGIASADLLKSIFNQSPVECLYLNTCDSVRTALRIHAVLPVALVATIAEIPDKTAFVTMSAFAHHLSSGANYQDAWFSSRTAGNDEFIFLPSSRNIVTHGDAAMYSEDALRPKINGNGKLDDIHDEVINLGFIIYGHERWKLPGLVNTVALLQRDVLFIKTAILLLSVLTLLLLTGGILAWLQ